MNYFEVFDLPRTLAIDAEALQRRFYELSRQTHPDFHQAAPPEEQARVLERSALLNAAYRTLRDPIARADYLIRLEEGRARAEGATSRPEVPPALLEEMLEVQEALQDAKAGPLDDAARAGLAERRRALGERLAAAEAAIAGPLARAWDAAEPAGRGPALAALKEALAARAYLRTAIEDLDAALGEGDEDATHVAHRRH